MENYKKQLFKKYIPLKKLRLAARNHLRSKDKNKNFFVHDIKMPNLNLSLDDLRTLAKIKGIRGYESMSKERLISSINESEKESAKIEKIKKDFNELRDRLSKPKIKEIRKDLYKTENKILG